MKKILILAILAFCAFTAEAQIQIQSKNETVVELATYHYGFTKLYDMPGVKYVVYVKSTEGSSFDVYMAVGDTKAKAIESLKGLRKILDLGFGAEVNIKDEKGAVYIVCAGRNNLFISSKDTPDKRCLLEINDCDAMIALLSK